MIFCGRHEGEPRQGGARPLTARKQKNATIEMLGARLTEKFTASLDGKRGKMGAG